MKGDFKKNLLPSIVGIALCVIVFTAGFLGLISSNLRNKKVNAGAYDYLRAASMNSASLDASTSQLVDAGKTDTSEYIANIFVSNERNHRTSASENWTLALASLLICTFILALASLSVDVLRMFSFYKSRVDRLNIILKAAFLALSVGVSICVAGLCGALPEGLKALFGVGYSCVVLPIVASLMVVNAIVTAVLNRNKSKKIDALN